MIRAVFGLLIVLLFSFPAFAAEGKPVKPSSTDRCPVCGMFVYKYPDWVAEIIFKDGSRVFFDGCKDMFKYYFNTKKYDPKKNASGIESLYAIEYYNFRFINATKAYFVLGSDVFGPMGKELIPFEAMADATEFRKDHAGKRILKFEEVSQEIIKSLD